MKQAKIPRVYIKKYTNIQIIPITNVKQWDVIYMRPGETVGEYGTVILKSYNWDKVDINNEC